MLYRPDPTFGACASLALPSSVAVGAAPVGRPGVGWRFLILIPAVVALLAGLNAGLQLLGYAAPLSAERLPQVHGMLLTLGFVGTVIALERAVALGSRAAYAAPAMLAVGGLLLISPAPLVVGRSLLVAGSLALVFVYIPLWRRQRDHAVLISAMGAALAVGASILWLGDLPVGLLLPWLVGFVVLTITGERLELARIVIPPSGETALVVGACAVMVGAAASILWPFAGVVGFGAALLALLVVLVRYDVARRTIRSVGLARYMAVCMLAAYVWLAVAGVIWLAGGPAYDGPRYDAVIHAVFLGFTFSMIMAHAPVILPAVTRQALPYRPILWVPVAGLQAALMVRLLAGDALGITTAWRIGGVAGIVALLLFFATVAVLMVHAALTKRRTT